jgi:hypothetical protein
VVTKEVVLDPAGEMSLLRSNPHDTKRLQAYVQIIENEKSVVRDQAMKRGEHYVRQYPKVFSPERVELVVEHHLRTGIPIESIMDEVISLFNQIKVFESDFYENYRFKMHFDEEAVDQIIDEALQRGSSATAVCLGVSRDFDYGFKLISDRSGQTEFVMPRKAVLQPSVYLDEIIRENYRNYPLNSSEPKDES